MTSGDYKYEIQLLAEERAEEEYGKDFYQLSPQEQTTVYGESERWHWEKQQIRAEAYREWIEQKEKI